MRTTLGRTHTHADLRLHAGSGLALSNAAGVELSSRSGRLWLTMEGDTRDITLKPGDAYTIERDGLTLVSAVEPSVVKVRIPRARDTWRERLARWWTLLERAAGTRARARLIGSHYYL